MKRRTATIVSLLFLALLVLAGLLAECILTFLLSAVIMLMQTAFFAGAAEPRAALALAKAFVPRIE